MSITPREGTSRVRFWIIGVLFLVSSINFASRSALSIAGTPMGHELGITKVELGYIFSAFAWAYVLAQLPCGALLDRFGSRKVYFWAIVLWSGFTAAQAFVDALSFVPVFISLFLLRLMLGLAEAPAFPANARLVANWFPNSERGTASAIFNSSQYFSLALFGFPMGLMTQHFGWRVMFLVMGGIGLASAALFAATIFPPLRHSRVSQSELDHIAEGGALVQMDGGATATTRTPVRWGVVGQLLSNRMLAGIYLGQYCVNALTYFFTTWFPIYLITARGMSLQQAGLAAAGPALCGFAGGVLGGIVSDLLLRRGMNLSSARKWPIALGFVITAAIVGCNFTNSPVLVLVFMSLAFFGKGVAALGWAVLSDVAPREATGLAGSLFNMFGNAAGIVTPVVIGYIVQTTGSFDIALIFLFAHSLVALLAFTVITGPIKRVVLAPSA